MRHPIPRALIPMLLCAALTACSGGASRNDQAAAACIRAAEEQLQDKPHDIDAGALAAGAKDEGSGVLALAAKVTIDGAEQTLDCRVRFVEGREAPDVIALTFIW